MRLLIDTQILLWAIYQPEKLAPRLYDRLSDGNVDVFVSAVSIAEIAIKSSLGRADFPFQPEEVCRAAQEMDFLELPFLASHSVRLATLAWHHRDPFDRMLIAQTLEEALRFVTADRQLAAYSDRVEIF